MRGVLALPPTGKILHNVWTRGKATIRSPIAPINSSAHTSLHIPLCHSPNRFFAALLGMDPEQIKELLQVTKFSWNATSNKAIKTRAEPSTFHCCSCNQCSLPNGAHTGRLLQRPIVTEANPHCYSSQLLLKPMSLWPSLSAKVLTVT